MKFRIRNSWRWLVALGAIFVPAVVTGALELPFTFKAGGAIKASEVNANFAALADKIDALSGGSRVSPVVGTFTLANTVADAPIRKFSQSISAAWSPPSPLGKPQFAPIVIERDTGDGSPLIDHNLCLAKALPSASVTLGDLTIDLTQVVVIGISAVAPRDGQPQEAISLSYGTVTYTWHPANKPEIVVTYDIAKNVGGGGVAQAFTYGHFPAGVAADAAYVPIASYQHEIACAAPAPGCKPQHGPLSVVKGVAVDTLDTLGLLLAAKTGSTVDVDFFSDAKTINNTIQLDGALVTGVALSTDASGALSEKVSFGYRTISWTVGNVTQGWDVAANQSL
jgi:type VI protein secretion system component Hcp